MPDEHIFDDGCIAELVGILRLDPNDVRIPKFQKALIDMGRARRHDIRSTPMNFPKLAPFPASLKQRVDWLERNAIKPAEMILDALSPQNAPYFSNWPDMVMYRVSLNAGEMAVQARAFLTYATELRDNLQEYRGFEYENAEHTNEMRSVICGELQDILKSAFPEIRITRGTYDNEKKQFFGPVIEYIRRAFWEITGQHEQLDSHLQKTPRRKK